MTFEPSLLANRRRRRRDAGRLGPPSLDGGAVDSERSDRARRVAAETGGRLDQVLTQLGLVSERGLAEALARADRGAALAAADYPETPLFGDRLQAQIPAPRPRHADRGDAERAVTLAMADPLDAFTRDAVAAALGRPVAVAVAVPIELEAAFDRLYPEELGEGDAEAMLDEMAPDAEPAEEDAERLKDLASEARSSGWSISLIARAVETHASDVHIEPLPGPAAGALPL